MESRHQSKPVPSGQRLQQRTIAEAAGVSISTVSRVLNNVEGISQELRERVLKAATNLGYQHKGARLEQIMLFISAPSTFLDPFQTNIMAGIEQECRRHDIRLSHVVFEVGTDSRAFLLERVKQNSSDGLLFLAQDDRSLLEEVLALNFRVGLINAEHDNLPVDTFLPDNHHAPKLAVQYLIQHGHRAIMHVASLNRVTIRHRHDAYRSALEEADIPYDPRLVLQTHMSPTHAYEKMKAFLASDHPNFTAVFCGNDLAAMGVERALQEAGLRIPQDVSLIGYDDISLAAFAVPPLTTVRVECEELGMLAVRRLLERVANPHLSPIRVEIFSRLIERQSVAFAHQTA
ncbi:MAG TPA: LacI family DNA-binding transcriptional regulator [Ktedonosporobacter sp.]|nr:LacI family DNA-binding transcriptional regulator [Ktedonosporobacter sp.]